MAGFWLGLMGFGCTSTSANTPTVSDKQPKHACAGSTQRCRLPRKSNPAETSPCLMPEMVPSTRIDCVTVVMSADNIGVGQGGSGGSGDKTAGTRAATTATTAAGPATAAATTTLAGSTTAPSTATIAAATTTGLAGAVSVTHGRSRLAWAGLVFEKWPERACVGRSGVRKVARVGLRGPVWCSKKSPSRLAWAGLVFEK